MEFFGFLQHTWFLLVGLLLMVYGILDGFDLGIGSLFPFLSKNSEDTRLLVKAIGPFWDGNEVWLITGAGALFASFPDAYATVFSGFYLAFMAVLFGLILRAASLEFLYHGEKPVGLWRIVFMISSLIPSLLFGVALGNVIQGIPLDSGKNFTGSFWTLLRPLPLGIGLLGLNAILLQGSTYARMKISGEIAHRSKRITEVLWISFGGVFLLTFMMVLIYMPEVLNRPLGWVSAGIVLAGWGLSKRFQIRDNPRWIFLMTSLSFCGLWGIAGSIHYPNLVKASNGQAFSITIFNGSSSELTLKVMLIIAVIGMPLVIYYTISVYRIFKGKVNTGKIESLKTSE